MKKWALLFSAFLLLCGCLKLDSSKGSLVVKILSEKVIPDSTAVQGLIILQNDSRTIQQFFNFPGQSEIGFEGLETGFWNIEVNLLDSHGYALYSAHKQVTVVAGQTTSTSISLELNKADLELVISVNSDQIDRINIELSCNEEKIEEQSTVINNAAFFNFSGLLSAVWNLRIELYSLDNLIMVCPSSGAYGLELQPGRTNVFQIEIDNFGSVTIEILSNDLEAVSNATAVNLDEGISIQWEAVYGADYYDIYRKEGNLWVKMNTDDLSETNFVDTYVEEGEEYSYVINARSIDGKHSGFSQPFTIVRDIRRVFVFSNEKIYVFHWNEDRLDNFQEIQVSETLLDIGAENRYLITVGHYPCTFTRYNGTTFSKECQNIFQAYPLSASFNGDYFYTVAGNYLLKLSSKTLDYQQFPFPGVARISVDDFLCAADNTGMVSIYALSDFSNYLDRVNGSFAFTMGGSVYVFSQGQINIYHVDGQDVTLNKQIAFSRDPLNMRVYNNYIYAGTDNGVYIVNIDDGSQNTIASGLLIRDLEIFDKKLYIVENNELLVYDLINPSMPVFITSTIFPVNCFGVSVD
ncbi:hypothetical protein [Pseudothermotoga sp.]|uniref:hypothetical protein n=1 Tax=Pseudothermotoga sp. TaxID=2033661 RepID=UPI00258EEE34|nr:hypothetical protein [Pseudothermotoga sp.]MDK2883998.1 hypothetical protein [Pseudothermotoga sp.]